MRSMFLAKHPDWNQPLSTTTRAPRPHEDDLTSMNFVSRDTFEQWQKEGRFLETDFHAGNWYGTLRQPVEDLLARGQNVLLRIDVNGALQLKAKLPEARIIFLKAENQAVLESRMRERGHEDAEVQDRLELARRELALEPQFEHVIVNRTGQQAQTLAAIEAVAAEA